MGGGIELEFEGVKERFTRCRERKNDGWKGVGEEGVEQTRVCKRWERAAEECTYLLRS